MSAVSTRIRRGAWVAVAIAVLLVAFVAFAPQTGAPGSEPDTTSIVTKTPTAFVVDGTPMSIYVGSFTGDRAVIQIVAESGESDGRLGEISAVEWRTQRATLSGELTRSTLPDGTRAVTVEFTDEKPIGAGVLVVTTDRAEVRFDVAWPTTAGV